MTLEPSKKDKVRKGKIRIKKRLKVGKEYMDLHNTYSSFKTAEKEVKRLQKKGYGAMTFGGGTHYLEGQYFAVYKRR